LQVFYSTDIQGSHIRLEDEEAKHCFKVLRHKAGDQLYITDGAGNLFRCKIEDGHWEHHVISIQEKLTPVSSRPYQLHIAIALTKNPDRLEWFIEKAVETGVDKITLLKTHRTEKGSVKMDRLLNKAISAMKQSLHFALPDIQPVTEWKDFISSSHDEKKYVAYCGDQEKVNLSDIPATNKILIAIGPEGDFTEEEILKSQQQGFELLSLGESRFRTETAALAACMGLYFKFTK
jgi:16S rRNA (uracil1498-N3)-methyltransferase